VLNWFEVGHLQEVAHAENQNLAIVIGNTISLLRTNSTDDYPIIELKDAHYSPVIIDT